MATVRDHITIAQLNRPITVNKYLFAQDDGGGNVKILTLTYELLADIQPISNYYTLEQLQIKYGEGYRITVRYEPSRLLTTNDEIVYAGYTHKVQGVRTQEEAMKRFMILTTAIGNSISNADGGSVVTPVHEYHWIADGDEYTVQADDVKNWTGMILLFRDKVQYHVIKSGTPAVNQVLYDSAAGTFTFSNLIIPLASGEPVDAYDVYG